MTKLSDHIGSWTLLGVMLTVGLVWSVHDEPPSTVLDGAPAQAEPGRDSVPHGLQAVPGGYDVLHRRRLADGFAGARLGFERDEDREPSWYSPAEAQPSISATSRNPISICFNSDGRECRAAARQTPQPLSSQEPPLTM